ncbi:MAG: ROK family protein [Chitinophagaceae bacterium]|nr:ROK family protein [Chitinophagaceae bacterium]
MYEHLNKYYILGVDVGGSHITAALTDAVTGCILDETIARGSVDSSANSESILNQWIDTVRHPLNSIPFHRLLGIGISMPGPFNYADGICLMKGINKYDSLYGIDVSKVIRQQLKLTENFPVVFENDAACFGLGESIATTSILGGRVIAITLGTGFGSTFLDACTLIKDGEGIPNKGQLYNCPYKNGIAEDFISARWILNAYNDLSGNNITEVVQIADRAIMQNDKHARTVFNQFGEHLAGCMLPWIKSFKPDYLVIGGSISKSSRLFLSSLQTELLKYQIQLPIKISSLMELSAITGAASLIQQPQKKGNTLKDKSWRKTSQALLPDTIKTIGLETETYNIYPFHKLGNGKIFSGYDSMARWMLSQKSIMIDGYGGNDWITIQSKLDVIFKANNITVRWYETVNFLKPAVAINEMVKPFLGDTDSVWGTKTTISLKDFYDLEAIKNTIPDVECDLSIIIGTGSALSNWGCLIYIDLPKNEIQYRMRAGSITNLGNNEIEIPAAMYKRFYFVDWVVLNKHRKEISNRIAVIADGQWKEVINWAFYPSVKEGLIEMSTNVIRVRPWFEAGAWGGQWMQNNIPQINKNEVNYAWSFELIVPENGVVLESDQNLLEVSFDWLMELDASAILGKDTPRFGTEFPIRFDFLDTFDGGNLSIQCHPSLDYIQQHFGETLTQDETYYILDCKDSAKVYLGLQDNVNRDQFRRVLENSVSENTAIDIDQYVQSFPSNKHDLFLIPNGTIHSAGKNNMVLEISATPYIFTFKLYDWVRLDLEGTPRPINIDHAFNNLNFESKGDLVKREFISIQTILESNENYKVVNLSTHEKHFYAIHRIEFTGTIQLNTNNQCFVMMLVEGESIIVKTKGGNMQRYNYAETFLIPAATENFELINAGKIVAKVIKAFIK